MPCHLYTFISNKSVSVVFDVGLYLASGWHLYGESEIDEFVKAVAASALLCFLVTHCWDKETAVNGGSGNPKLRKKALYWRGKSSISDANETKSWKFTHMEDDWGSNCNFNCYIVKKVQLKFNLKFIQDSFEILLTPRSLFTALWCWCPIHLLFFVQYVVRREAASVSKIKTNASVHVVLWEQNLTGGG